MTKHKLTLSLSAELIAKAHRIAHIRNTSISELLSTFIALQDEVTPSSLEVREPAAEYDSGSQECLRIHLPAIAMEAARRFSAKRHQTVESLVRQFILGLGKDTADASASKGNELPPMLTSLLELTRYLPPMPEESATRDFHADELLNDLSGTGESEK